MMLDDEGFLAGGALVEELGGVGMTTLAEVCRSNREGERGPARKRADAMMTVRGSEACRLEVAALLSPTAPRPRLLQIAIRSTA